MSRRGVVEYRRRGPDSGITGRGAGQLLAVTLTDVLSDGLSMVYSFFDPEEGDRSLGTFMILDHIERAKRMGLPYVYLGYWVRGSRKMDYKGRFLPQERLMPAGWTRGGDARSRSGRLPVPRAPHAACRASAQTGTPARTTSPASARCRRRSRRRYGS